MIIALFISINSVALAEKISIKGLDISYDEFNEQMTASGNAELHHPKFTVYADTIIYNHKTNKIHGNNNVELIQDNQIILSDTFKFDTETNQLDIENLSIEFTTEKKHQQIYVKAIKFSDQSSKKTGKQGIITTCDHSPPHYYIESEEFVIHPEKRIIGQNVTLVNPIYFVPFGFWTPAYIFELGERKIIYLMPVIGNNKIEGGFIKNQFDFVINDQWTGEGYVDYMSTKGIGLGTRLNYDNYTNNRGSIYYYGVTDQEDNVKEWTQTYKLSPQKTLSTHIRSKNIYLLQGGYSQTDTHSIKFKNKPDGAIETTTYTFNQNNSSSVKPQTYKVNYTKTSDDNSSLNINLNQTKTTQTSESYSITNQQLVGHNIKSKNNILYSQEELSATDSRRDSYLRTQNSLSKTMDFGTLTTAIDYYFDTDEDTVTKDIKNHIVQKTPEIDLNLKPYKLNQNWTFNEKLQYGYYSEYYYMSELDLQRTWAEHRLKLDQNITGIYNFNFLNGSLSSSSSYNQYYYASGDETYTISHIGKYRTDSFSFLQTETSHTTTGIPENGNTPFFFDERNQKEKNELEETITLYLVSPTKYHIKYSSGYNWIIDYQLDNKMQMLLRPNPTYRALFRTTYMHQLKKYSPLVSRLDYIPTKKFNTSIQANYDLNDGEMINLNHILNTTFGSNWENRWKFNAYFTYAPKYDEDYQLQTLEIIKDLHCRQFTLIYNRLLEEIRFQFTINAFPENNIGFTSNKYESFRLEGVFDDASIQR